MKATRSASFLITEKYINIPTSVAMRLDRLQRDFVWGGVGNQRNSTWLNGAQNPVQGLGTRKLGIFNQAILGKCLWCYAMKRGLL